MRNTRTRQTLFVIWRTNFTKMMTLKSSDHAYTHHYYLITQCNDERERGEGMRSENVGVGGVSAENS